MEVRYAKSAVKALMRSNKRDVIKAKIDELAENPDMPSNNITPLKGRPESRLRVQDWRVIFRIEDGIIWIDDIGPRGSIYEDRT